MIWTILGISVAIVAVFCISVAETLVGTPGFEHHREYIAATLAAAGIGAWFIGRYLGRKHRVPETENAETVSANRFVLIDLRYWGPMLLVLGVITLFIRPLRQTKEVASAAPAPVPKPVLVVEAPKPETPAPKGPVLFPTLKMQGVFFRETRPFAIINGHSYAVGDHVGDVIVKAIDRTSVMLELAGELKLLTLN
jgi:hypothetical protein